MTTKLKKLIKTNFDQAFSVICLLLSMTIVTMALSGNIREAHSFDAVLIASLLSACAILTITRH